MTVSDAGPDVDSASQNACSIQTGLAGVTAVLHNADGTVSARQMTDASGAASFESCSEDSLISFAVLDPDDGWRGATIAGVQPGDDVEVMLDDLDITTMAQIDIPVDNSDISFIRAWAGGTCSKNSSEGATASLPISTDCLGDDETTLSVLATGRIDQVKVFSYSTGSSIVAAGDTVVSDMSGWMTGPQVNLSASNVSDAQIFFDIQPVKNGRSFGGLSQLTNVVGDTATQALSAPPTGFTTERRLAVSTSGLAKRGIMRQTTGFAESFDMAVLLPEVTTISVDNTDAARPVYTIGGALTSADLGLIYSSWTNNATDVSWRLFYPAGETNTIKFPVLPAELAGATPDAAEAPAVYVIDITNSDYAGILANGYRVAELQHGCADIPAGGECWFSSLYIP
jgi:hypothetical protein